MTNQEIQTLLQQQMGFPDFLTGETIIESASVEQNINGDGKLSLSWKSLSGGVIPVGTVISTEYGDYVMMEAYTPTVNNDGTYSFSPSFTSKDALASKTLFSMVLKDSEGNDMRLYTFPFTGYASTIAAALGQFGWSVDLNPALASQIVTVSIDGDSVKSAADKVASALGTNAYFVNGTICIGTSNAFSPESYYNCFVVLGGTRNMAKKTIQNSYAQVTQRLTLDSTAEGVSAGSVIDLSGDEPKMEKLLIFDDVYPKMELVIDETYHRRCWMMDEAGNKVVDHYEVQRNGAWVRLVEVDGQTVPVTSTMEGATPVYKQYTKWYVKLAKEVDGVRTRYTIPLGDVIENKPLGLLFQSGALAGREFDLAAFTEATSEHMDDDVSSESFTATTDMYRIIMVADGSTLIPNNDVLIPSAGDKVTPLNVKFDNTYKQMAQAELLERAMSVIPMYHTQKASGFQAQRSWADFLTGGSTTPDIGDPYGNVGDDSQAGYIVTSVVTDLMTGAASITYGTFKRKGLLSSMADKIDSVQLSGGQATVGQVDDDVRHTAPMGIDQYNTLRSAGGALGMKAVNRRINEISEDLQNYGSDVDAVKEQADKRFDIYFGSGTPTASNYPASDWTTDADKEEHLQDIYYDTNRQPASTGGRAWRWVKVSNAYLWQEITDADTIASLEKIADVASDGILSAGTEKVRILGEWTEALNEYTECLAAETTYGTSTAFTQMKAAFVALGTMLNGNEALTTLNGIPTETPEFIADLTERTRLSDYTYTDSGNVEHSMDADYYRSKWDTWYEKLAALKFAITGQVNTEAKSKMQFFTGSSIPTGYKTGDMWLKDGTNYICSAVTPTGTMADWQEVGASEDVFSSITNLLSELTILIVEKVKAAIAYYKEPGRTNRDIRLYLAQTMPLDAVAKEFWFDGTDLLQYDGTDWNELTDQQGSTVFADAVELLTRIVAMIGYGETITFHREMSSQGANLYDVYFRKATFFDKFSQQTFEGGLGIWIYGRYGWEHIIDNTTGLLENYGDHIINAVFGDSTLANLHVPNFASAMMTSKNALELFSRMMSNGKTMAEALFALGVDVKYYVDITVNNQTTTYQVEKDGNGWKYASGQAVSGAYTGSPLDIYAVGESNAKLSADNISFDGKKIVFRSNNYSATSGALKIGIDSYTWKDSEDVQHTGERCEMSMEIDNNERFILSLSKEDGVVHSNLYFWGGATFVGNLEASTVESQNFKLGLGGTISVYDNILSSYVDGVSGEFYAKDSNDALLRITVKDGIIVGINNPI